jgi:metal-responsive CopG/Arc/MetJ family transcriptional regulator
MKIAVSIPEDVFKGAERLAMRSKKSRSQLYSKAVREYVARHSPDEVAEAMTRVCDDLGDELSNPFVTGAAQRILASSEW